MISDEIADLAGKTVVFLGKLDAMPRSMAASYAEERGAIVRRGVTRRTDIVVVGHGAYTFLETGKLDARLVAADRSRAVCVSENTFLRAVGLLDLVPSEQRSLSMDDLEAKSDLALTDLQLMALFDLIESREGQFGFRDLVSAKEVARLLWDATLQEILQSVSVIRQYGDAAEGQHLARTKLVKLLEGPLGIRVGDFVADLNGQLRLSLSSPESPSVDALFEAAEQAEEGGDLVTAETLYRRCADLDKKDPTALFNLANVLRENGRRNEAEIFLRQAVGIDASFPEAWYNLADVVDAAGRREEAVECLQRAVAADPEYADALYNLARFLYDGGDYEEAAAHWERYVRLDPNSEWGRKARDGLAVCRQRLQERQAG